MPATKLENLLKSGAGGSLEKLIQTAQDMDALTGILRASLDPDAATHLLAASLHDDGQLVVICSTSAWASRIRFEEVALIGAAQKGGFDAETLRVRVSQG